MATSSIRVRFHEMQAARRALAEMTPVLRAERVAQFIAAHAGVARDLCSLTSRRGASVPPPADLIALVLSLISENFAKEFGAEPPWIEDEIKPLPGDQRPGDETIRFLSQLEHRRLP